MLFAPLLLMAIVTLEIIIHHINVFSPFFFGSSHRAIAPSVGMAGMMLFSVFCFRGVLFGERGTAGGFWLVRISPIHSIDFAP